MWYLISKSDHNYCWVEVFLTSSCFLCKNSARASFERLPEYGWDSPSMKYFRLGYPLIPWVLHTILWIVQSTSAIASWLWEIYILGDHCRPNQLPIICMSAQESCSGRTKERKTWPIKVETARWLEEGYRLWGSKRVIRWRTFLQCREDGNGDDVHRGLSDYGRDRGHDRDDGDHELQLSWSW